MTTEQMRILNSLLTFAAENVPGGLNRDEQQAVQVFSRWVLGEPFYAVDMGAASLQFHNDGQIYVTENGQKLFHAKIKSPTGSVIQVAPGDVIDITKEYGPLVFMPLRISMNLGGVEWIIERYCAADNTWELIDRVPGQLSTDFKE